MNSDPENKIPSVAISVVFNLIINILPAIGVIFWGWNAISMLALYIWEGGVVSFYAVRMRSRILEYHLKQDPEYMGWDEKLPPGWENPEKRQSNKDSFSYPSIVFFPFFIIYSMTIGICSLANVLDIPTKVDSVLFIFFSPFIVHPQLLLFLAGALVGNQLIYSGCLQKESFKRSSGLHPEIDFYHRLIILVSMIVLYWPLFMGISVINSVSGINSQVFANDAIAIILFAIKSIPRDTLFRLIYALAERFGNKSV
jgi:hypothetical protein